MNNNYKSLPYLYKFRSFDNPCHFRTISHCEFWFASPNQFNDIFDCNIPIRFDLCPENWRYEQLLQFQLRINPDLTLDENVAIAKRDAENDKKWLKFQSRIYEEIFAPKTGILSLTTHWNKFESQLMWSHYANAHRGFVIGIDQGVLLKWMRNISGAEIGEEQHENGTGIQVRLTNVKYCKLMPNLIPCKMDEGELIFTLVTHKSQAWYYENEVRLLMSKFDNSQKLLELEEIDRSQRLPPDSLAEIIIGANARTEDMDRVKQVLRFRKGYTKLYQAEPSEDKYVLKRKEIAY